MISLLAFAVATTVTLLFWDQLFNRVPFALYFGAVSVAAWFGGRLHGVGVAVLGVLAIEVAGGFSADLAVPSIVLLGVSFLISQLAAARERALEALRAGEVSARAMVESERARLADVFERSPSFMAVLREPAHVFEMVNARYYELIGHRQVIGKAIREALPEVAGQGYVELLDHVYATGEPHVGTDSSVLLQRRPDEPPERRYVEFVFQPRRDARGEINGVFVHGFDTTQRVEAAVRDRLLTALDDAVRSIVDAAEVTATCARILGEHLDADRCAYADVEADEDTFNLTGDYNRGVPSIVGRYRFTDFGAEVLRLMREGKPCVVNDVDAHEPPLGDLSYYRQTMIRAVICVPLQKAGRFVAAMAVHQRTPRPWTGEEVDLVRAVAARCWESIERSRVIRVLRESEAQFRQLADAMPQIVWAARPDGQLDYYNRRWFAYVMLPDDGTATEAARWDRYIHPDDLPRTGERWVASLATGEPYSTEFRVRDGAGTYRWFLARALAITNERGDTVRSFGTCTDVHDYKELQQQNRMLLDSERAARSEAERASRMKEEFLATLSHELRTPLNAIMGWVQILKNGPDVPPDMDDGLATIERNARAQTQIIEDLLDMSRIVSGKVRLDVRRVDLVSVVRAAVETVKPAADARGIRLQTVLDPSTGPATGDPNRLQQVLWNLLNNAVKFTPRGGRVQVLLERVNSHVEISVIDSGDGIAPEFLPHVFDRFRQADASTTRRHGGLGLGLSIVKQLVELHGGSVRVKSAGLGSGSTFTVALPLTVVHPEPEGEVERHHPTVDTSRSYRDNCPSLQGVRVLVVDDEADARTLVKRLLEDCEAIVETASTATEALERLRTNPPHVLISDIGMPGEDGYSFITRVRAAGFDLPAVALTAYARTEDRLKVLRAGFQMHVVKPVEPAELVTVVAVLAGRK